MRLARIGFDNVLGALADPVEAFLAHPGASSSRSRGCRPRRSPSGSPTVAGLVLVDVRNPGEVALGTIPAPDIAAGLLSD